jgi:hypothetical protein
MMDEIGLGRKRGSAAVPSYLVRKRVRDNAVDFIFDLSNRLSNQVQISSDSLRSYVDAALIWTTGR